MEHEPELAPGLDASSPWGVNYKRSKEHGLLEQRRPSTPDGRLLYVRVCTCFWQTPPGSRKSVQRALKLHRREWA
jgi:hypothetical protein